MSAAVKAVKKTVKAVVKTAGKVVKAIAKNPVAVVATVVAPQIGAAIGLSAPVAVAATNAAVTLAQTGDIGKALVSGAAGGLGQVVGTAVGNAALASDYSITTANIVGSAAKSAVQTAVQTGGDATAIFKAALAGGAGSAGGAGAVNVLGEVAPSASDALTSAVQKAAQAGTISAVLGGDPIQAALTGAGSSLASGALGDVVSSLTKPTPTPPGLAQIPASAGVEKNVQYTAGDASGAPATPPTAPSVEVTATKPALDLTDTTPALLDLMGKAPGKTPAVPSKAAPNVAQKVVDTVNKAGGSAYVDPEGKVVVTATAPGLDLVSPGYVFDASQFEQPKAAAKKIATPEEAAKVEPTPLAGAETAPPIDVTAKTPEEAAPPMTEAGKTTYFGPSQITPQDRQILQLIGVTVPSTASVSPARGGGQAPASSLISAEGADLSALFGGKDEPRQDVWNESSLRLRGALGI